MRADRIVAAVRRFLLDPDEQVTLRRDETAVDFLSYRRYSVSATLNLDVVAWTVTAPVAEPARWTRRPVAERPRIPLS